MKLNTPIVTILKNFFHLSAHLQSVKLEELEEITGYSPEEIHDGLEFLLRNYKGLKGRIEETESRFFVEENNIYCENEELKYEQKPISSFNCPSCGKTSCIWCFGPRIFLEQPVCPACLKKITVDSICWNDGSENEEPQSQYVKALMLLSENRVLQATRELEAIDLEKTSSRKVKTAIFLALGTCYLSLKKADKAWKSLKQAQQLSPRESLVHLAMGLIYEMDERDEKALEKYRDALEIEPDNPMIHMVMGNLLEVLARNHEALAAYKKAIELDPTNSDYWINLGDFYDLAEKDEEAEEAYIKATELEPDNPEIWKVLGFFYEVRDRKIEAAMCYTKVINLSPEDEAAANYITTYMKT
ncbi:MAG: tetratricopeptide repeat protein, partial [Candidatus Odinarchaeota archaeon]